MAAMSFDQLRDLLVQGELQRRDGRGDWTPAVDLYETATHYILMAELAGLTIGDIEIRVEASSVTVAGRRPAPAADGDSYLRVERGHGAFSRSFAFPQGIDGSAVAAELREGVLTIMLPKARMPEARRVTVE